MYEGKKVIDVHGHHSTPVHFRAYAYNLVALRTPTGGLDIPDEAMNQAHKRHIQVMDERRIDVQFISPRPVAMMHWEQPALVHHWTEVTNDIIHKACQMLPDRFRGIAQLPQVSKEFEKDTSNCVGELERSIKELGFVGALVNPDPAGDNRTPGMNNPYWYPIYEKAQALQAPLIVHPSISRDPRIAIIPHNYQYNNVIHELLTTQLLQYGNVFKDFPRLKVVVCHCGGALSRFIPRAASSGQAGGGQVGMAARQAPAHADEENDWPDNLFFDTCAYDKDFLATAIKQRSVDQMMFGTEAPGSGTGALNADTGRPSDDIVPVIDDIEFLSKQDKLKIFRENAIKAFPLFKE